MAELSKRQQYEYRVSYRRAAWHGRNGDAVRLFESEPAARRFAARLLSDGRPELSRVVGVTVQRREVGRWGDV